MEGKWVKVYSTKYLYRAEIAKGILEENSIPSVIINKQDSAYLVFGEIELYVFQIDALKATHLIQDIKYE